MPYEHHESYKHKLAKELLFQWIKEIHDDRTVDYSTDHHFGKTLPFYDRGPIMFVPDITIFHKGQAKIFIEVVHTNGVSKKKANNILNFFKVNHIEVYEIFADNILNATNKHRNLKFDTIIYDDELVKE